MLFAILLASVVGLVLFGCILKNPFLGLLLMILVGSVEALIPLPSGLTLGRLVGFMAVAGWLVQLSRYPDVWRRIQQSPLVKSIWFFPAVCIAGLVFEWSRTDDLVGLPSAVNVCLLATMAIMIETLVDSKRRINLLLVAVIVASIVATIPAFAYHWGYDLYTPAGLDPDGASAYGRASGLASDANGLGVTASTGLFAVLILSNVQRRAWSRFLLVAVAFVIIGSVVLSGSRTHFVAAVACAFAFGCLRVMGPKKNLLVAASVLLLFLGLVFLSYLRAPKDLQERLIIVGAGVRADTAERANFAANQRAQAVEIFWDHPLLGLGLMSYTTVNEGAAAHDSFSATLGETGGLGTLGMIWLVLSSVHRLRHGSKGWQKHRDMDLYYYSIGFLASMIAMLVAGLGGYVIFYQRWFWLTIGISSVIGQWRAAIDRPSTPTPEGWIVSRKRGSEVQRSRDRASTHPQ